MKVYVAGAWVEQKERAKPMIAALRKHGVHITCDWTVEESDRTGGDSSLSSEERLKYALMDLKGVYDAQVVWLLAENGKGACGSWIEFGAALALNRYGHGEKTLVVSGANWRRSIFTELADHRFEDDGLALEAILAMRTLAPVATP